MIKINLLPIEKRQKEQIAKQNLGFLIVVIGIFIILVIIAVVFIALNYTLKAQILANDANIQSIESSLDLYKDTKQDVIFIKDRLKELNNLKEKTTDWSGMLKILSQNTPNTIILTDFTIDYKAKPEVKIIGYADSRQDAVKFQTQLENSGIFTDVAFESSKKIIKNDKELIDFTLTANKK